MNKHLQLLCCVCGMLLPFISVAQQSTDRIRTVGFPTFPVLSNANIPGAPILSKPQLINGTEQDIRTEKHGLAYPAVFDWNRDGKKDLLVGEFETGETGSFIKVFLNEGTNKRPRFSGKYAYATTAKGDTITNHQWCCIGIHPRLVDINNDGWPDMLSGQYDPGLISLWNGGPKGFGSRVIVEQEGFGKKNKGYAPAMNQLDPANHQYWLYSSAAFGDFNGDGMQDLFTGGFGELRVAVNTGTKTEPRFGLRKNLLGLDGMPISVVKKEKKASSGNPHFKEPYYYSGVYKSFVTPVDWDNDGVLDLLVTHAYSDEDTKDPVVFFRGVRTDKGLRFLNSVPLFTAKDARKTFPGCQPNLTVTDYNADGVQDLVFGLSMPTVNGFEIDSLTTWGYLREFNMQGPGKDAGKMTEWEGGIDAVKEKMEKEPSYRAYFLNNHKDYKYLTLRHRGYIYVMYGKKNPVKAVPVSNVRAVPEMLLNE